MSSYFIRPDVEAFLQRRAAAKPPQLSQMTPTAARALFLSARPLVDKPIGDLAFDRIVVAKGAGGNIPIRIVDSRPSRGPSPILIFYHGGGFVLGNLESHASICAAVARRLDIPVAAVDYRLAPEHPWPAAPDDAEAAARWIVDNAATLGRAATSLVLAGDSSGGALSLITALALRNRPAAVPVVAAWCVYPAVDAYGACGIHESAKLFASGFSSTAEDSAWFAAQYRPDKNNWRASPIKAELAGLPPLLISVAGLDPLRDQGRAVAAAAIQAGVWVLFREERGTIHGWAGLRRALPSAAADLDANLEQLKFLIEA